MGSTTTPIPPSFFDDDTEVRLRMTLEYPHPAPDDQFSIPLSKIARPSDPDDPSSTIVFDDNWRKIIAHKYINGLEITMEEFGLHDLNHSILQEINKAFDLPHIKNKTSFTNCVKIYLVQKDELVQLYPRDLLHYFTKIYAMNYKGVIDFHLTLAGTIKRLFIAAIAHPSNDSNTIATASNPPNSGNDTNSVDTNSSSHQCNDHSTNNKQQFTSEKSSQPTITTSTPSTNNAASSSSTPKLVALHPAFQTVNGIQPTPMPRTNVRFNDPVTPQQPETTTFNQTPSSLHYSETLTPSVSTNVVSGTNPTPQLANWTYATFDPNHTDLVIDPDTGHFLPWRAFRPKYGNIICYPTRFRATSLIRSLYLASFTPHPSTGTSFDPKNYKIFQESFPTFGPNDAKQFLSWHSRLVEYCLRFGIYIPPIHTLRHQQPLGVWFDYLPEHVQINVQNNFANLLAGCLRKQMKSTLAQEFPALADAFQNQDDSGYDILYRLAYLAGNHPLLAENAIIPQEPIQNIDMTVSSYITLWNQFLKQKLLDGTVYCDRYFHIRFLHNLQPIIRNKIGPYLHQDIKDIPINQPLPDDLSPKELVFTLHKFAENLKLPDLISKTPRSLFQQRTSPVTTPVNEVTTDDDIIALVAAVNLSSPNCCYICQANDHKMVKCPAFLRLKSNPKMLSSVLRALQPTTRSNSKPEKSNSKHPPRHIRQIDAVNDNENNSTNIETGEGSSIIETGEGNDDNLELNPDTPDQIDYDSDF